MQSALELAEVGIGHLGELGQPTKRKLGHASPHPDVLTQLA